MTGESCHETTNLITDKQVSVDVCVRPHRSGGVCVVGTVTGWMGTAVGVVPTAHLLREDLWLRGSALQHIPRLLLQLLHGSSTRTAGSLWWQEVHSFGQTPGARSCASSIAHLFA